MTIKSYPLILCFPESIDFIYNEECLKISLYYIDKQTLKDIIVIYENGECYNLSQQLVSPINLDTLTQLVQQSLINEGQCCVEKILLTSPSQAFPLLKGIS
ncbi:hypothetical protein J8M01_01090 [Pseudoalteromonas sp. MMG005]|nr:hypothetical protein [Pseudoalteromonas sp. MMG005]